MTREDILQHAREQGLPETATEGVFIVNADDLGRMLSVEREACAKVCANWSDYTNGIAPTLAEAIRARGQA